MLQRVFKVNCRASNLQVDQAVPDLLSLFVGERSRPISARLVTRDVLKDVIVPEDRVLHKLLVSQSSHRAAVLVDGEFENISLNLHVNVVIEQSLSSHFFLHKYFKSANQVPIAHLGNEHGQQADHSLEEILWDHI